MADTERKTQEQLIKEYAEKLESGIQNIFTSGRYEEYLKTMSRFHKYSMRNTALIFMQNPDATQVAGFGAWDKQFERHVSKGEKGIKIFAPAPFIVKKEMEKIGEDGKPVLDEQGRPVIEEREVKIPAFKIVSVFDAAQTYGKPLPQLAETLTGNVQQYDLFRQALTETSPFPVLYEQMDEGMDGYMDAENRTIHIREGMSQPQTALALIHERSHAELHSNTPENETPEQRRIRRTREEVEAESISYTVCQYFGIETGANSFGYIANWSSGKELTELQASLETIKKAASNMITSIETRFTELQKEAGIAQEAEAAVFAADYYNYMATRNEDMGLPRFGMDEPETVIEDITQSVVDGSGIADIRDTLQVDFDERGNQGANALLQRLSGFEQAAAPEQTAETPAPGKRYELGYGHMGNGLTVWNRLEEKNGDYVTVAHIAPDRTVTYYDPDLPEDVRVQIEQTARTSDMHISATQDAPVFTAPPQAEQQRESEENNNQQSADTPSRYSELQQKGFQIALRYEKQPLQDRLNIIAETFGCKTASIKTVPCTGQKWRGTSDISIVLDNGASLFVGNYRTPQAKTVRVQSECVNNALAGYNPEIVSEAKERATAALLKREAADNAVAAEKGLKPYTFLNVELNSGSDEASGGHLGWYYVTLAVNGKIVTHLETGLNHDIARGVVAENNGRANYFTAGALKDTDVDYVFNNVGFSSTRDLYTVPLTTPVRKRAQIKLMERQTTVGQERSASLHEAMQGLKQEVTATLQFFIDRDLQDHGAISESTLEAIAVQGYEYRDGRLELAAPEADSPEKLAQDLYDFVERVDYHEYKNFLGIGEDEQPLQSITQFIENGKMDFVSLLHLLDSFINDYFGEPDMKNEVHDAEKLYTRFTAYDDERQKLLTQTERPETNTYLPDPHIGLSERDLYGYTYENMLPLLEARALELYDQDHTIYLLYPDGTEAMAFDRAEIEKHDGIFGIESEEWTTIRESENEKAALRESEVTKEAELLNGKSDCYGIYQLMDYQPYRYDSFDKAMAVMRRDHYTLMYTAPLLPGNKPENLYALHSTNNRPDADKMRSMSPSDVLVMKRGDNVTALYVDRFGFYPIQGFLERENHIKVAEMSTEQNYNMIDGIPNNTSPETDPDKSPREIYEDSRDKWLEDQERGRVESHEAAFGNYAGMVALIGKDDKVYLGKRENCSFGDSTYYDNSDNSLVFISGNKDIYPFLHGEGWTQSQQELMRDGIHTPETYGEWAALQAGILAQFEQTREILFNGVPFKAPNHAPTVDELEADVKAGRTISLLDLANAVKNERKTDPPGKKRSLLGQLEKGKRDIAQNKDAAQKDAPTRKPGLEVN